MISLNLSYNNDNWKIMIINYPDYSRKNVYSYPLEVRVNNLRKGELKPGSRIEVRYAEKSRVTIKLGLIAKIQLDRPENKTYTIAKTWWLCNFSWVNLLFTIVSILLISLSTSHTLVFYAVIVGVVLAYITIFQLVKKKALRLEAH
jgi:hypothetical protein